MPPSLRAKRSNLDVGMHFHRDCFVAALLAMNNGSSSALIQTGACA
jgi:hypothetical protein